MTPKDLLIEALLSQSPSLNIKRLHSSGLLLVIIPEIANMIGCGQNRWHAYDVWEHTLLCTDLTPNNLILRIAALLHDIGKPVVKNFDEKKNDYTFIDHEKVSAEMAEAILNRLTFSEEDVKVIVHLIDLHLILYESSWSDSAIRRWVKKVGKEHLNNLFLLAEADAKAKGKAKNYFGLEGLYELKERTKEVFIKPKTDRAIIINGNDIIDYLNISPGPIVGFILNILETKVAKDPGLNKKEILLKLSKEVLKQHGKSHD